MERIQNHKEVLKHLRDGELITSNGKDQFILKKERVFCYREGTRFSLDLDAFSELYGNTVFYIYEDSAMIDEEKDEAYYRYYKK